MAGLVKRLVGNVQDLGSSPRSSPPFHIFFQLIFICNFSSGVHHAPTKSNCPRVPEHSIKGSDLKNTVDLSQHPIRWPMKVNQAMNKWASNCWAIPPLWGQIPP